MPIYEFKCNTCNAEFETIVASFTKVDTVKCIQCGGADISRIPSTVNSRVEKSAAFQPAPSGCRSKSGFS